MTFWKRRIPPAPDYGQLEDRVMLSATPMADLGVALEDPSDATDVPASLATWSDLTADPDSGLSSVTAPDVDLTETGQRTTDTLADVARLELVFVDTGAANYQQLVDDVLANSDANRELEVYLLDSRRDGIEQITSILAGYDNLDAVHLISHGSNGQLKLGNQWINAGNIGGYAGQIAGWNDALRDGADLLIYGCNLAATAEGQELAESLGALCNCDVAASADDTGHASLGGDWNLEFTSGAIETQVALSMQVQQSWLGVLANGTYRDAFNAISYANTDGSDNWSANPWQEIGESNGPGGGQVRITTLLGQQGLQIQQSGTGAWRQVDLSGAATAQLTFDYARLGLDDASDYIVLEVSGNGGTSWSERARFQGPADDTSMQSASYDISAFIAANTQIRFVSFGLTSSESLFVDNVQISFSSTTTSILTATGDTYIDTSNNDKNYGNLTSLIVDKSGGDIGNQRALLQFDLSGIPSGAVITSATLHLNATQNGGPFDIDVYRVTEAWVEGNGAGTPGAASWDDRQVGTSWSTSGGAYNPTPIATSNTASLGQHSWNITSLVQGWHTGTTVNQGIILGSTNTGSNTVTYDSREGATPPVLEVAYGFLSSTPEFLVNTEINDDQETSSEDRGSPQAVAVDANGDYVVVWTSDGQDGVGSKGVYGQRFYANGTPRGGEFRVNQTTLGDQQWASVDTDDSGNFVVTWTSQGQDGSGAGVYARKYFASGSPQTVEFVVNTTTLNDQDSPVVAMDADGDFVIVWEGNGVGDTAGIFAQRYNSLGVAQGGEILVNSSTANTQYEPSVAMDAIGNFVIVWDDNGGFHGRRFNASGTAQGSQFTVTGNPSAGNGDVAMDADGDFVVAWRETALGLGVFAQRYSALGVAQGIPILVTTTFFGDQTHPSVDMDGLGNFVVAWEGNGPGDSDGIFLQQFSANGVRRNGETSVNQTVTNLQNMTSVAMLGIDNFVVVWSGEGPGDGSGVFARQFSVTNSPPTFTSSPSASVPENTTSVITVTTTDVDGGIPTYSTTGGADQPRFTIDASTGLLTFSSPPDFENPTDSDTNNVYIVEVTANDGRGGLTVQVLTVTVIAANDNNPVFTSASTRSIGENQTIVHTLTATDADLPTQTVSFTIAGTGSDDVLFFVNGSNQLAFISAPDYETALDAGADNVYNVDVQASDGNGGLATQSITVTVLNLNESPTIANLTGDSLSYNEGTGAQLIEQSGDAVVSDLDSMDFNGGTLSVSLAAGGTPLEDVLSIRNQGTNPGEIGFLLGVVTWGGTNIGTAVGGAAGVDLVVSLNANATPAAVTGLIRQITYENLDLLTPTAAVRTVRFIVNDGDGANSPNYDALVTVNPTNNAPVITSPLTASVNENTSIVQTLTASDPEGDTIAYSITGGDDGGRFFINGSKQLVFSTAPDYESASDLDADNAYDVEITADDGNGGQDVRLVRVTVLPVNDNSPVFSSSSIVSVSEGTASVLLLTATDADRPTQTVTYALTGGVDVGLFTIDGANGLKFVTPPDFEFPADANADNIYDVDVTASDGNGGSTVQVVQITVTNANDDPVITSSAAVSVPENTMNVVTVTSTDIDGGAPIYSLVGGADASRFTINSATGALRFVVSPNFELSADANGDNTYEVRVRVGDGSGGSDDQLVLITVTDANDAPAARSDRFSVENDRTLVELAPGVLAGDADEDADPLTVSLVSGPTHGTLTLHVNGSFVYAPNDDFSGTDSFVYQIDDGNGATDTATVSITVNSAAGPLTASQLLTVPSPRNESPPEESSAPNLASAPLPPAAMPTASPIPRGPNRGSAILTTNLAVVALPQADAFDTATDFVDELLNQVTRVVREESHSSGVQMLERFVAAFDVAMLWNDLSDLKNDLHETATHPYFAAGSVAGMTTSLTVGYVLWTIRSGWLATSLLAQMPAWRIVDPLVVLTYLDDESPDSRRGDRQDDDDSLESLLDKENPASDPQPEPEPEPEHASADKPRADNAEP